MRTERKGDGPGRGEAPRARRGPTLVCLAAVTLAASQLALAQSTTFDFAPGRCVINAAVLSIENGFGGPILVNPNLGTHLVNDPGLMEGLRRASFRPTRWDIVNPRGATDVAGAYIPEGAPAYWEVVLEAARHTDLSGYDLLYAAYPDITLIDRHQLDSLVEAVNEGAVLWIDYAPRPVVPPPPGPGWAAAPFAFTIAAGGAGANLPDPRCLNHALLTRPFRLSPVQVGEVGDTTQAETIAGVAYPEFLHPVLRESGGEVVVSAGRYGSGAFVVTSRRVGREIALWMGAGLSDPLPLQAADVSFAYNLVAWASGWAQSRQSPRGAALSIGEVRADLDVLWQSLDLGAPVAGAPVIDDSGREFVVTYGTPRLYCFDADPPQDLDGDGLADDFDANPPAGALSDGQGDYAGPGSADLLWAINLEGTPRSTSPAAATAVINGNPVDVVLVSQWDSDANRRMVVSYEAATGQEVWRHVVAPYADGPRRGEVVSLSTPLVHNGYVYVLASEMDQPNDPDRTYGRVSCFDLATGGDAGNGFWWVYPDPTLAPSGGAADQYWMPLPPVDDPVWVADPNRTELPPIPTAVPSVGNGPRYRGTDPANPATTLDAHLEAVIYFGAPAAKGWNGNSVTELARGCDYALVPTPARIDAGGGVTLPAPDPFLANRRHYAVRLRNLPPAGWTGNIWTYYVAGGAGPTDSFFAEPPGIINAPFAEFPTRDVEGFLGTIPNGSTPTPYVGVQTGCQALVLLNYDDAGTQREIEQSIFLPGPVLYERRYPDGTRRVGGQSICEEVAVGASTGGVVALHPENGEGRWVYDTRAAQQWGAVADAPSEAAPADSGDTLMTLASVLLSPNEGYLGQASGLDPRPDITVQLRSPGPVSATAPIVVALGHGGGPLTPIDPGYYRVDYANNRITFPSASADNVQAVGPGPYIGPVYGRMLVITFTPVGGAAITDVYSAPDLSRWDYAGGPNGAIRLRHHPVRWSGPGVTAPSATLANGVPVAGLVPGEMPVTVGAYEWLPTGLLNCGPATYGANNTPVQRGAELLFSYEGMTPNGLVPVPNAYETFERHQVPWAFGRPLSGVAAANDGQAVVAGTESFSPGAAGPAAPLEAGPFVGGYYPDYAGAPPTPTFLPDPTRTLLALAWNPVTNAVSGRLVRPVYEPPALAAAPRVPIVSSAPAVDGDTVHVGSRILDLLPTPAQGYGGVAPAAGPYGYASALSPARTVITDDQRIVETVGSRVDWVCTGPRVLDPAWLNADAQGLATFPEDTPGWRLPFSRPAKALRLTSEDFVANAVGPQPWAVPGFPRESALGPGNYLIVDTGNNRVIEVDRKGRQLWPLANYPYDFDPANPPVVNPIRSRRQRDGLGFDFYTSPGNTVLSLSKPTDAHRYWRWNGVEWEMHTVIADSGNDRVIDVITTLAFAPPDSVLQAHRVEVLTPPQVATPASTRPGEIMRVGYTRAQPLFDPGNGQVVGYLCAANNLHELLVIEAGSRRVDPPATDSLPGGTAGATWSLWAWLYEEDVDGDPATDDRLIFENLRHAAVSYQRDIDGLPYLFLTVVCGRYRGPLANPYAVTVAGQPAGPLCLEFRLGGPNGLLPGDTTTWVLRPANDLPAQWFVPYWWYTDRDYQDGPLGHFLRPGQPQADVKVFWPACAQRLSFGRHVIANYRGAVENLTHPNLPTATNYGTPPSLVSDVFEVETRYGTPNDPATQQHIIDVHKAIPDPWGDDWTDPFNQPSFAQRYQDRSVPVRP